MNKNSLPTTVILLCVTAFLAPICGGNLNLEVSSLEPGLVPFIVSIFAGTDTPGFAKLAIALGAFACAFILVLRRRVLQLPSGQISVAMLTLVALLTISVVVSPFKNVSVVAWTQWIAYCIVFFAAASGAGRVRGPKVILGALAVGCTVVGARGIHEWGLQRVIDPTWRIFGGWNNPNAVAGMLVIGLIVCLALCTTSERLGSLLSGIGAVVIGLALFLTQSRGGLLAAAVGTVCLLAGIAFQSDKARRKDIVKPLSCLVLSGLLVGTILFGNRSGMGSRVVSNTSATEQSTGFRKLLWRGAAKTMFAHPVGTGLGTYSYFSAESGLTSETRLTHNTLLQLGVEASAFAPIALLALFGFWGVAVLRGKQPQPQTGILRIGIVAAIVASLIDGLFESNLYYFGTGVAVFLLLGLGLQAATDAVAPEFSPAVMRRSFGFGIILITAFLGIFAFRESVKSHVRYDRHASDPETLMADLGTLRGIADGDGEAHYLLGIATPNLSIADRVAQFREAANLEPSLKHFNMLAQGEAQAGNETAALSAFRDALKRDSNNPEVLNRLLEFYKSHDHMSDAIETAKQMVAVDGKPYASTRALSEIIPVESAEARVFLASQSTNKIETSDYLGAAIAIYLKYARITVPYLRRIWGGAVTSTAIANETQPGMLEKLERGVAVAKSAVVAYRAAGRLTDVSLAEASEAELERVLADVSVGFGGNK